MAQNTLVFHSLFVDKLFIPAGSNMPLAPSADAEVPPHCPQADRLTFYLCWVALPEWKLKFLGKIMFQKKKKDISNLQNMWKMYGISTSWPPVASVLEKAAHSITALCSAYRAGSPKSPTTCLSDLVLIQYEPEILGFLNTHVNEPSKPPENPHGWLENHLILSRRYIFLHSCLSIVIVVFGAVLNFSITIHYTSYFWWRVKRKLALAPI